MTKSNQILCVGTSQENKRAESPLVALTLPLAATRLSLSPLGPEPLKDPWLSAPCSRGVWRYQFLGPGPTWERAWPRSGLQLPWWTALARRGRILLPVPCGCQVKFFLDSDVTRKEVLPPGHLLGHVEQEVLVCFVHAREQPTELAQHAGLFASAAPGGLQRRVKEINLLASVMEQKEPGKLQHLAAGNPKHR